MNDDVPYSIGDQWSVYYNPDNDYQAFRDFYENVGWSYTTPSDPKLTADVTTAKAEAQTNGNTKLANTLDFILKYGDKALTVLTKNGIIRNQNLVQGGYTFIDTDTGQRVGSTNRAPDTSSRVFNLDFTDPKVLILTFGAVLTLFYFLFFRQPQSTKR